MTTRRFVVQLVISLSFSAVLVAQGASKCSPPQSDSSFIDDHGTAHVTRVVPVPDTLSPEAQKVVAAGMPDTSNPERLPKRLHATKMGKK